MEVAYPKDKANVKAQLNEKEVKVVSTTTVYQVLSAALFYL